MTSEPRLSRTERWRRRLDTLATVAVIVVSASVVWAIFLDGARGRPAPAPRTVQRSRPPDAGIPDDPLVLANVARRGSPTATLALIEYSDFQCTFCATFARETLPALEDKYIRTGKVALFFRHLPLAIHPFAQEAAEAAECAGRQGSFWAMHDGLFADQGHLAPTNLSARARALGLDPAQFDRCLTHRETAGKVRGDADAAKAFNIAGTPTFLIGRVLSDGHVKVIHRFSGAQPLIVFEQVLDRLLSTATVSATSKPASTGKP